MDGWLNETFIDIDYTIAKFLHTLQRNLGKPMTHFMEFISVLGESGILMIILGLILCIFPKTRKCGATVLFALAISSLITLALIKPLIERARPYLDTNSNFYKWWLQVGSHSENGFSFPSGHTTASMAFALAIFSRCRNKKLGILMFIFPIVMALSRMYMMVHYFSDCLGGLIIGSIGAIIGYFITHLLFDKSKGKFNQFVNYFEIKTIFNKNKK